MTIGDLVPWARKDRNLALPSRGTGLSETRELGPFLRLHQEMNRLFDDVFRGFDAPAGFMRQWPTVELSETDEAYKVTAELPGLDEKDVELSFDDGALVIRGEKKAENARDDRTVTERFYGQFERRIALGDVEHEQARATFDKGLLTVTLPKSQRARDRVKRIPINGGTRH